MPNLQALDVKQTGFSRLLVRDDHIRFSTILPSPCALLPVFFTSLFVPKGPGKDS